MTTTRRDLLKQFGLAGLVAGTLRDSLALADAGGSGIRRVVFFYLPSGIHQPAWRPSVPSPSGVAIDAPKYGQLDRAANRWRHALEIFDQPKYAPLKSDLMLVDGLDMRAIARPDIHINGIWAGLRGRPKRMIEPAIENGRFPQYSIDRLIGDGLDRQGRSDPFLVSQCTNVLVSEIGQQATVGSHSEGHHARVVRSSSEAWDLFVQDLSGLSSGRLDNSRELARLDSDLKRWGLSLASATRLKATLPAEAGPRLEQFIDTLREKQAEIMRTRERLSQPVPAGVRVPPLPPRLEADPDPSRFMREKSDLLAKVMSVALGLNRTQVVVWQTCGSNNDRGFWYAGGTTPNFHNSIAHGGAYKGVVSPATWDVYDVEMQMLGNLLLELKSIPEGTGTALDSTLVVTYADMSNGGHNFNVPVFTLLAGGRNGRLSGKALKHGKYVKLPAQRPHNDLLLTVAHLMGVTTARQPGGQVAALDTFGSTPFSTGLVRELFG